MLTGYGSANVDLLMLNGYGSVNVDLLMLTGDMEAA